VKRSLLVEKDGGPLAVVIAGANVPDAQLLAATIEALVVERPEPEPEYPQHLCLDKGYDNETGWGVIVDYDYTPQIRLLRDLRPPRTKRYKPRRCVVERTLAWLSKCRAIAGTSRLATTSGCSSSLARPYGTAGSVDSPLAVSQLCLFSEGSVRATRALLQGCCWVRLSG
jgi:hypothetical protein